ncbi:MAG: NTP transferase domain-containing protein [Hymenobacteraceae bacterium]|nr:NTP transferase domain-containing protein [Hymenobacteraceae bacterium]MDX5396960.1 NTP transferase domain-containing protein [Hymenobacteraceae bacterium]MDX5443520.1 NTP transferase domain-containing protein [Hymenobacteraceae bacterium]MDX5513034.1 NTP transferase domain-containing protein [Hymenobacteraceae bacterium]
MRIIIPMAGMGKRMRPHTLTIPKPLIPIAGKPIVHRLVEDIAKVCQEPIEEVAFIIGHFGEQVEQELKHIAESVGARGSIYYQEEALGTAHAIMCAKDSLQGKVVVAFADTLFKADFTLDTSADGTIWVQQVDDPRAFGVIKMNDRQEITDFVEKPQEFVSDLAIIGIYYFKDGEYLRNELQYLLDNDIRDKGEYQLTNALENMKNKGTVFVPARISEWLDCGNKNATVYTNQRYLEYIKDDADLVAKTAKVQNSVIIPPVYIGENVVLNNSVVGPHVSIGNNTVLYDSIISNSIVQEHTTLKNANMTNSMVGNFVEYQGSQSDLSIGDYNTLKE